VIEETVAHHGASQQQLWRAVPQRDDLGRLRNEVVVL
jgi:hypothetical protein